MAQMTPEPATTIDDYISQFSGVAREWLDFFAKFMAENHPELVGRIAYQVPLWRIGARDFGIWATKTHFAFHTTDYEILDTLRMELPNPGTSKANVNLDFTDTKIWPHLTELIDEIVVRNNVFAELSAPAQRALSTAKIYTAKDLTKWRESEILQLHGVGAASLPALQNILAHENLEWKTGRK